MITLVLLDNKELSPMSIYLENVGAFLLFCWDCFRIQDPPSLGTEMNSEQVCMENLLL